MGKNDLSELINFNIPIVDDNLVLSHDEISSLLDNKNYVRQFNDFYQKYMDYLNSISGKCNICGDCGFMNISINDQTQDSIITFSSVGLLSYIAQLLEYIGNDEDYFSVQEFFEPIKKLKRIKNEQELSTEFPHLYKWVYLPNKEKVISKKLGTVIYEYESAKKDFLEHNKLSQKYKNLGYNLEATYKLAKSALDFRSFIETITSYFNTIAYKIDDIDEWAKENPIKLKLNNFEIKKVYLYILFRQIENMKEYASNGFKKDAQKGVIIIEKLIDKYRQLFPNDTTQIKFERFLTGDSLNLKNEDDFVHTDFESLVTIFENTVKEYPFLKRNLELPKIDKETPYNETKEFINSYIESILNDTIKEDIEEGSKEIDDSDIEKIIKEIENDIKSGNLSPEELSKKKLILKKIHMVLVDLEPIAKHTGIGAFKSYYVYYYPNGMVAVDKIKEYGAIYIMPVHIYKEARYKRNLTEVQLISGVKPVSHKRPNWLEETKEYILNGTENLTERDIIESQTVASIDFPYTIEGMLALQKKLEEAGLLNERMRRTVNNRKKRTQLLNDIDKDLKSGGEEKEEISDEEFNREMDELEGEESMSFDELYLYWKKNHKDKNYKRNPAVAKHTKDRARDEEGNYCCEWCGKDSKEESFESFNYESHHVIPLNMGGIDNIYNTVCLCPSCHTYVHSPRMTYNDQYHLLEIVRKHVENECPEYLDKFNKMISPIARSEKQYNDNKKLMDFLFSIQWNDDSHKKR